MPKGPEQRPTYSDHPDCLLGTPPGLCQGHTLNPTADSVLIPAEVEALYSLPDTAPAYSTITLNGASQGLHVVPGAGGHG